MNFHIDFGTVFSFFAFLIALAAAGVLLSGTWRKTQLELIRQTSDEWKNAASQRQEQINDLKVKVSELEKKVNNVTGENQSVMRLNYEMQLQIERLQTEKAELKAEVNRLRAGNSSPGNNPYSAQNNTYGTQSLERGHSVTTTESHTDNSREVIGIGLDTEH